MSRSSGLRSRSSSLVLRLVLRVIAVGLLLSVAESAARAEVCLPPTLGERPRLHQTASVKVFWLELLLRQHDVCWRPPASPDEKRVFVYGNSAIFGFPHASEQSAIAIVNRLMERRGVPLHLYNLGFNYSYQLKDVLIVSESLRYEPDMIIYAVTFDDLMHLAPLQFTPVIEFFASNSVAVERLADSPPPTLGEPFRVWSDIQSKTVRPQAVWQNLRQAGTFLRVRAGDTARAIRKIWFPDLSERWPRTGPKQPKYDCAVVTQNFHKYYKNWKDWTVLEYLAELRTTRGIDVLIVNFPVAHLPEGKCYNNRYPTAAFKNYTVWLRKRARDLKLPFLDLHAMLKSEDFVDSLHPSARGQNLVAAALATRLEKIVTEIDAQ